jgi:hypothetical protein
MKRIESTRSRSMIGHMFAELRILILKENIGVTVFEGSAAGHDDDPVRPEDRVDSVSDGDDGAVVQRRSQDLLDQPVGLEVHVGSRFVHADNLELGEVVKIMFFIIVVCFNITLL